MATLRVLSVTLLFAVLSIQHCICADTPESSPSPAPEAGGDVVSSPQPTAAAPESPAPSPLANVISSPPSPPPADRSPDSAPATTILLRRMSLRLRLLLLLRRRANESSSGDGMNGGKKAGVAFGAIAAACVVGLGALVYKKRRQNIRRAQFGYAARRSDFL
uniref:Proline-rich receptor-like protein kinase PERK1 n=1 Tax=Nicotiana sylvestris TaxID=4096 RepID=A0A1U7Y271_NICSY|nr:PREDICTED: proline-rich receptor-like protein kinase PERK1 [Nicotiana sylvestris]